MPESYSLSFVTLWSTDWEPRKRLCLTRFSLCYSHARLLGLLRDVAASLGLEPRKKALPHTVFPVL